MRAAYIFIKILLIARFLSSIFTQNLILFVQLEKKMYDKLNVIIQLHYRTE